MFTCLHVYLGIFSAQKIFLIVVKVSDALTFWHCIQETLDLKLNKTENNIHKSIINTGTAHKKIC